MTHCIGELVGDGEFDDDDHNGLTENGEVGHVVQLKAITTTTARKLQLQLLATGGEDFPLLSVTGEVAGVLSRTKYLI